MNIKTLEFIHELLKEKAETAGKEYKREREILEAMEESENKDHETIAEQRYLKERKWQKRMEAENAMEDFESQEW